MSEMSEGVDEALEYVDDLEKRLRLHYSPERQILKEDAVRFESIRETIRDLRERLEGVEEDAARYADSNMHLNESYNRLRRRAEKLEEVIADVAEGLTYWRRTDFESDVLQPLRGGDCGRYADLLDALRTARIEDRPVIPAALDSREDEGEPDTKAEPPDKPRCEARYHGGQCDKRQGHDGPHEDYFGKEFWGSDTPVHADEPEGDGPDPPDGGYAAWLERVCYTNVDLRNESVVRYLKEIARRLRSATHADARSGVPDANRVTRLLTQLLDELQVNGGAEMTVKAASLRDDILSELGTLYDEDRLSDRHEDEGSDE